MSGLQVSIVKFFLSAMRQLHLAQGMGDPGIGSTAKLEQVVKGIKTNQAKHKYYTLSFSARMHTSPSAKPQERITMLPSTAWLYPGLETPFPTPLLFLAVTLRLLGA